MDLYLEEARTTCASSTLWKRICTPISSPDTRTAAATGAHLSRRAGGARFPTCRCATAIPWLRTLPARVSGNPGHTTGASPCWSPTWIDPRSPFAVLTGDTLFIGDVGRFDLPAILRRSNSRGCSYDSLHEKPLRLPDAVEVYPRTAPVRCAAGGR